MSGRTPQDTRPCPTCGEAMLVRTYDDLVLDVCPQDGVWFDDGEFVRLMERAGSKQRRGVQRRKRRAAQSGYDRGRSDGWHCVAKARRVVRRRYRSRRQRRRRAEQSASLIPPPVAHGPRPCPVCRETMRIEVWRDLFKATPDVTVDLCDEHGLWLDHGEMEVLLERAREDARRSTRAKIDRAHWEAYDRGLASGSALREDEWHD